MSKKSLLTLLVIFIALLGTTTYPIWSAKLGLTRLAKDKTSTSAEISFSAITPDSIDKIDIVRGESSITLAKSQDGGWLVSDSETTDAPTDETKVDTLFSSLALAKIGQLVGSNEANHVKFGVDTVGGTVVTFFQGDDEKFKVVFGYGTPSGGDYVRLESSNNVYIVSGNLRRLLPPTVEDWLVVEDVEVGGTGPIDEIQLN